MGITKKAECQGIGPYPEMLHHQYTLKNIFQGLFIVFVLFCLSLEAIHGDF